MINERVITVSVKYKRWYLYVLLCMVPVKEWYLNIHVLVITADGLIDVIDNELP